MGEVIKKRSKIDSGDAAQLCEHTELVHRTRVGLQELYLSTAVIEGRKAGKGRGVGGRGGEGRGTLVGPLTSPFHYLSVLPIGQTYSEAGGPSRSGNTVSPVTQSRGGEGWGSSPHSSRSSDPLAWDTWAINIYRIHKWPPSPCLGLGPSAFMEAALGAFGM